MSDIGAIAGAVESVAGLAGKVIDDANAPAVLSAEAQAAKAALLEKARQCVANGDLDGLRQLLTSTAT